MGDLADVFSLEQEVFGVHGYPLFFFRQALDVFGNLLRIAVNDTGTIAGYVLGALKPENGACWILSLAVKNEYRRMGIATGLMLDAIDVLSSKGADEVFLTVAPGNTDARACYRALGFRETETVDDYFGPGETRIIMRKDL
ncbi:GNAT family N-acetyltransferase [bacterium]|nr:GNAT family N-acetyltransferase [bacterium]